MKILHLFDFFSPHGGGTVALLYVISQAQAQKGHEVTIYTSDFKLDREYIASLADVEVYPFHCVSSLAGFYLMPSMICEVKKKLRDFDIIHLHCHRSFQNIVIHHYAKKYGIPYVIDAHGSVPRMVGGKRGIKWLLKWLFDIVFGYRILKDADRAIAESEVGAGEYRKLNVNESKIVLISPPLDISEFSLLPSRGIFRSKYDIKEEYIIIFVGRINSIKGLDFLVESIYELARLRNDVILIIVGSDDGYKSALDKLIYELDLSGKVMFTGFLSGVEKLSALVDADVFVQTSIYEQGIRAPFEAVLCNTPIIVTGHTGAGEIVKKADIGFPVEYGDKTGLRDMIIYVLENPDEATNKIKHAREYIETNLSYEKGVDKYEQFYKEVISGKFE